MFTYFSLEAAEELGQVGVFSGQGEDSFLSEGAVHVIVLQDHVFLQHFDGVHLITAFQLCQHHLVTCAGCGFVLVTQSYTHVSEGTNSPSQSSLFPEP